ncbi:MAG: D-serine deaminase-like pyridoxal phosphate-dependent protein [Planctomycetota bacterium]|jgi:D-serine deaminase-like pyridoxal phosphate-dependent protein
MSALQHLSLAEYILDPSIARRLCSPALVINLSKVKRNIRRVLDRTGSPDRWRPHVKTTKSPRIWNELIAQGVRQFKCATAREAQNLAQTLHDSTPRGGDILLAHPAIGPTLQRLGELATQFPESRFSVISEDPSHVREIPQEVGVFVDIDPGYQRTGLGIRDRDGILAVARSSGTRFRGVHYYEGHLTSLDMSKRRASAFAGYEELLGLLSLLQSEGLSARELITSGTPGFLCALDFPGFNELGAIQHRVSPGTVVFHDWRSETQIPELELEPAAFIFTRVVSHAGDSRFTCDAGSKSLAAEAGHPCAFVIGHPQFEAQVPSEEHLPIVVQSGPVPERGTQLYLVPKHICPTVNLAEEALLVDSEKPVEVIKIVARAHDSLIGDSV